MDADIWTSLLSQTWSPNSSQEFTDISEDGYYTLCCKSGRKTLNASIYIFLQYGIDITIIVDWDYGPSVSILTVIYCISNVQRKN